MTDFAPMFIQYFVQIKIAFLEAVDASGLRGKMMHILLQVIMG